MWKEETAVKWIEDNYRILDPRGVDPARYSTDLLRIEAPFAVQVCDLLGKAVENDSEHVERATLRRFSHYAAEALIALASRDIDEKDKGPDWKTQLTALAFRADFRVDDLEKERRAELRRLAMTCNPDESSDESEDGDDDEADVSDDDEADVQPSPSPPPPSPPRRPPLKAKASATARPPRATSPSDPVPSPPRLPGKKQGKPSGRLTSHRQIVQSSEDEDDGSADEKPDLEDMEVADEGKNAVS